MTFPKRDLCLILAPAFLRSAAISFSSLLLGLHLAAMGFGVVVLGVSVACGLAGCAAGVVLSVVVSGRLGRRKTLALVSFLMAAGGLLIQQAQSVPAVYLAAFLGMLNGMGRDRGAGLTLDQSMLPALGPVEKRTWLFSWYSLICDGGNALGALLLTLPALGRAFGWMPAESYLWGWGLYASLCLAAGLGTLALGPCVESPSGPRLQKISQETRPRMIRFALLSGVDSFGGGFLSTALISYWFFTRFGLDENAIGPLFFAARLANGFSHLGAAWIAGKLGLVRTMVFTHIPASLLLIALPWVPSAALACTLFLLRETLVEMDLPTRQSYLMAIVPEHERVQAAGLTNAVRVTAWTAGAALAGPLAAMSGLASALYLGSGIKIIYDLMLYRSFRRLPAPEEKRL